MAATIARAKGYGPNDMKETSRLGTRSAVGEANTYKTFTTCCVRADGSGYVQVERVAGNGERVVLHRHDFDAE